MRGTVQYEVHLNVRSWCQVFNSGVQVSAKRVEVVLAHRGLPLPLQPPDRFALHTNNTKVQTECRDTPSFSHKRIGDS